MKVSQLIKKLENVKAKIGDADVLMAEETGDCFDVTGLSIERDENAQQVVVLSGDEDDEGDGESADEIGDVIETTGRKIG